MRRVIRALLVGSLAFGLVAAAASGASLGLTLQDVIRVGTFDQSADVSVIFEECEGEYLIEWDIEGQSILGFTATRNSDADPDDSLEFCAEQPYRLAVSRYDADSEEWGRFDYVATSDDNENLTDGSGDITATFDDEDFDLQDGDEVMLLIGPEAETLL
jgi:hypothetical protein